MPTHDDRVSIQEIQNIEQLVDDFESCTLPKEQWTHHAHLIVALWYLRSYSQDEATEKIRSGIQRFNHSKRVRQTPDGGYHETITRFYIWIIAQFLAESNPAAPLEALALELISRFGARDLPLEYWTKDRLMSWEARTSWVLPDRKALE